MAQLELVPWVELPEYVQVGFVAMGFLFGALVAGLAGMQCYDYDYFNDSERAAAAYSGLMFLGGSFAFIATALLIVSTLLRLGILR